MKLKIETVVTIWLLLAVETYADMSLIHHYTFDGVGVVDSAGSADGTLMGGATVGSGVLTLDGIDDYVQFAEKLIPTSGSFSLAFRAQELSAFTTYAEIISQGQRYGGFYVGYDPWHNVRVGDDWMSTGVPFPSDGDFHLYGVTKSDADTRLYIDGRLVATLPWPIGMISAGNDTRLGRQFDYEGSPEFFHGNIDELWIYRGTPAVVPVPGACLLAVLGLSFSALLCRHKEY
jgi:hypothetical protein